MLFKEFKIGAIQIGTVQGSFVANLVSWIKGMLSQIDYSVCFAISTTPISKFEIETFL